LEEVGLGFILINPQEPGKRGYWKEDWLADFLESWGPFDGKRVL